MGGYIRDTPTNCIFAWHSTVTAEGACLGPLAQPLCTASQKTALYDTEIDFVPVLCPGDYDFPKEIL